MFERYYSISDAFQAADAVARVTVGDWQGEDLHNWVTFFDADVQESYKGDLPRHFTLVQGGCSSILSQLPLVYKRNRAFGFPEGL